MEVHGTQATDRVLEPIAQLDNVRILQFVNATIPDAEWRHLAGHAGVRELMAANVEVRAEGLAHIAAIPKLERLMLNSFHIDDEALRHLSNASTLRVLSLDNAIVSDAGLEHLAELTELQGLALPDSRLTDAGLVHLSRLEKLIQVDLRADDAFTAAGVTHLQALPQLQRVRGIPDSLVTSHLPHVVLYRAENRISNQRVTIDFDDLPLVDVCKDLSRLLAFPIVADEDVGNKKITLRVRGVSALAALELLGELHGLAWTVSADCVQLSARGKVRGTTQARNYDLAASLGADPRAVAEIARAIPKVIAPDSWAKGSPESPLSVTASGVQLTVVQSPDVQRKIELLLDDFGERGVEPFMSAAEREIFELLDEPATLKVNNLPLDQLLSNFPDQRLSLVLDIPAFTENDIATDAPITVRAENLPLRQVLDLIFGPLGLAWTVKHETVVVFPIEKQPAMLQTHVYHIGEILAKGETAAYVAERVQDDLGLVHLPGRFATDAFNRVVVRADFREHRAIQKLIDELDSEY